MRRLAWSTEGLAARLAGVTTLTLLVAAGLWLARDDATLQMSVLVVSLWLTGTADSVHWSFSNGVGFSQTVLCAAVFTVLAYVALSGVRHSRGPDAWQPWLVTSGALLGAAYVLDRYRSPVMARLWDLGFMSGLAAGAVGGLWILDSHLHRLPWAVAGVWLVHVARAVHSHRA
ncbi:hypothetical protein [Streptomyces sp. NPDC088746]|uniref:hypothetical protein n=1 Tax=Streptomyces sp. NPDC088746 TaxID=3365885 RepID=UPI003808839E